MGFKKLQDLNTENIIALGGFNKKAKKDNPTEVEGYYLGSRVVANTKNKSGKAYIHVFQTPKGNIGVWGKTDMDQKLIQVTPGTMTKVEFSGMKDTKNGEMYVYDVSVDDEQTIEVGGLGDSSGVDYTTTTSDVSKQEQTQRLLKN